MQINRIEVIEKPFVMVWWRTPYKEEMNGKRTPDLWLWSYKICYSEKQRDRLVDKLELLGYIIMQTPINHPTEFKQPEKYLKEITKTPKNENPKYTKTVDTELIQKEEISRIKETAEENPF